MNTTARMLVVVLFLFLCVPGAQARQQLIPFEQGEKWGYKDARGKIIIAPTFITAHNFSREGIAAVIDDTGWAYITPRGTIIIRPFVVDNGPDPFQEGLARFTHEGKFGFFNRRGKVVIAPQFDFAGSFQEGLSVFCRGCTKHTAGEHSFWEGGTWGYIDRKGNIAIPPKFDSVKNFDKGRAQVIYEGKELSINKKGRPLTTSKGKATIGMKEEKKEAAPSMKYPFTEVLDAEWKKTKQVSRPATATPVFESWNYYVSPPFPVTWPPSANQQLYYYAYAMGLNPESLKDGTYVSAPWGCIEIQRKGNMPPKFLRLAHELREIGIQGVRPLREGEAIVYKKKDMAETYLRTLASLPDDAQKDVYVLREYYCTWTRNNAVIAKEIRAQHIPFFAWLGCKSSVEAGESFKRGNK